MQTETLQVYESDKAMIDSQVATAKHYPRDMEKFIANCIMTVNLSKEIAEECVYTVPRGTKKISGPSVNLAKIMMQYYGNFRAGARVVDTEHKHVVCEAVAFDMENNVSVKVQVKRSIMGRDGRFNDDMITVTGNAGNSIALRNAIFAVLPKVFVDKVYDAAKKKIVGDVSTEAKLIAQRQVIINKLKSDYKIEEKDILFAIGRESVSHITTDDLVVLAGINTAIKEGDTTVDQAFRGKGARVPPPPKEDRVVATLRKCENIKQLESFFGNLKTNEQRQVYEEMYAKLKKTNKNEQL